MTIVFTNCKISCFLVRESIKTYVTKLMHDFIQIIHPRSRNQCTVKQTDMQAGYLLWHLMLPFVKSVVTCCYPLVFTYCKTNVLHWVCFYSKPETRFSGRFYNSRFSPPSSWKKNIVLLQGLNPRSKAICSDRVETYALTACATETNTHMFKIISGILV